MVEWRIGTPGPYPWHARTPGTGCTLGSPHSPLHFFEFLPFSPISPHSPPFPPIFLVFPFSFGNLTGNLKSKMAFECHGPAICRMHLGLPFHTFTSWPPSEPFELALPSHLAKSIYGVCGNYAG